MKHTDWCVVCQQLPDPQVGLPPGYRLSDPGHLVQSDTVEYDRDAHVQSWLAYRSLSDAVDKNDLRV